MFKKLFLAFIALHILTLAALAIAFPRKNEHVFKKDDYGMQFEEYDERHWKLLAPADWGLAPAPPIRIGCGPIGSSGHGVRRFGFIGIVEKHGWQTTEDEWEKAQKLRKNDARD